MYNNETNTKNGASLQNNNNTSIMMNVFETIITSLIFVLILLTFFCKVCTVVGDSMNNTLIDGERLIISNLFYSINQGDVIVFHETENLNEPVVKRVIATGNKWVLIDFDNSLLYVSDDEILDETDIVDESSYVYFDSGSYDMRGTMKVYVPEGYLFVMGDNRNNSTDSRSEKIGLVDERDVLGKAIVRFFPFDSLTFLN